MRFVVVVVVTLSLALTTPPLLTELFVFFVHYLTPLVSHTPCLHAYTPPSSSHIFVQSFSFVPHASCTHPSFRAAFWLMHPFFLLLQQIVFSLRPHASLSRVQTSLVKHTFLPPSSQLLLTAAHCLLFLPHSTAASLLQMLSLLAFPEW